METLDSPRTISSELTFNALVDWFYDKMLVKTGAPGFLIGLSGTDSLVSFCAAYKALEKFGKPERMLGVHFAPSEDFLYDHPEAETHLWFSNEIVPWLRQYAPKAEILIDTSIDWRCDGLRWGYLMDLSVVSNDKRRMMRLPEEQYWVVGTRNKSEDILRNYSNVSTAASLQPLLPLWKSEILQLSEYLGFPQLAMQKSCETDCICGRLSLPSRHIREVDTLLMVRTGELSQKYLESIEPELRNQLSKFVEAQISKSNFKAYLPYAPRASITSWCRDPMVVAFERGTLPLKEFNHRQHLYVAWCYLKDLPVEDAVGCYSYYLQQLLNQSGKTKKFDLTITRSYFARLGEAMKLYPASNFDEMYEKSFETLANVKK